jgi:TonB-linked SusC/RagA family outer membrane protein
MRLLFTTISILLSSFLSAQVITGTVSDSKNGEALIGATVMIKNSQKGTATDAMGKFSLEAKPGNILIVRYTGYQSKEVAVGNALKIDIQLSLSAEQLQEAVVVGYGTKSRKDITGSISSVSGKDLDKRPITRIENALQGQAAGVQVLQYSGKPGNELSIRVRGTTSLSAGNEPLYVLDGIPLLSPEGINPSDIASIEVLKDASAAAIYGARAANGVVLITTKLGTPNKPVVSVNYSYGTSKITKMLPVLGTTDYIDLINEEYINAGGSARLNQADYTTNTNWQKEIYRTAPQSNFQISLSGGTNKSRYYYSINKQSQDGIVKNSGYERTGARINMTNEVKQNLRVGTNIAVSNINFKNVPDNSRVNQGGVVLGALSTPTLIGIYNPNGTYTVNPLQAWENPIANIEAPINTTNTKRFVGSFFAEYDIIKNLTFKSSFNVEAFTTKTDYFLDPFRTQYGRSLNGIGYSNTGQQLVWLSENTLTYKKAFGKHDFNFLGGYTAQASRYESTGGNVNGYPNAAVSTLNAGSRKIDASSSASEWALLSYLGRVSYKFQDKYLAEVNLRCDGSSRFGADNRYGYFPSASVGWRISEESFIPETKWIDDLKLRLSLGTTGNQNIGDYASFGLYSLGSSYNFNGTIYPGTRPSTIGNNSLKWESTTQFDIGFDYSFLNYAITITADYYVKRTNNLLVNVDLPRTTGFSSGIQNIGEIENRGLEFAIKTKNIAKANFTWITNFNISNNKNKIINIGGEDKIIYAGDIPERGYSVMLKQGGSIGQFYGFVSEGIDPQTGNVVFKDLNGDGQITDADRKVIGNANPIFIAGLNNTLSYKNFDLDFLFQACYGNQVLNATRIETEGMSDVKNASTSTLNRWRKPGDITDMPIAMFGDPDKNSRISDRFIEDGSYLRLRNITLSYHLPLKWLPRLKLSKFDVYVSGQNLWVLTKYSGYDPEVNRDGNNSISQGIDYGTYPQYRSFIGGLKIEF